MGWISIPINEFYLFLFEKWYYLYVIFIFNIMHEASTVLKNQVQNFLSSFYLFFLVLNKRPIDFYCDRDFYYEVLHFRWELKESTRCCCWAYVFYFQRVFSVLSFIINSRHNRCININSYLWGAVCHLAVCNCMNTCFIVMGDHIELVAGCYEQIVFGYRVCTGDEVIIIFHNFYFFNWCNLH